MRRSNRGRAVRARADHTDWRRVRTTARGKGRAARTFQRAMISVIKATFYHKNLLMLAFDFKMCGIVNNLLVDYDNAIVWTSVF